MKKIRYSKNNLNLNPFHNNINELTFLRWFMNKIFYDLINILSVIFFFNIIKLMVLLVIVCNCQLTSYSIYIY